LPCRLADAAEAADVDAEPRLLLCGRGRQFVDQPEERVVGIEVTATLRPGHVPRMS
jgi:hypothetical protein